MTVHRLWLKCFPLRYSISFLTSSPVLSIFSSLILTCGSPCLRVMSHLHCMIGCLPQNHLQFPLGTVFTAPKGRATGSPLLASCPFSSFSHCPGWHFPCWDFFSACFSLDTIAPGPVFAILLQVLPHDTSTPRTAPSHLLLLEAYVAHPLSGPWGARTERGASNGQVWC